MPTPIGHALAGAVIYGNTLKSKKKSALFLFAALFFALLPDIDFLFGIPFGNLNLYHHGFTHSFVFVIVIGWIGGRLFAKMCGQSSLFCSAIFASAGISHVILDCLAMDKRAPFGCPIFWPFSQEFYISPILLFSDVSRVSDSRMFLQSLLNAHNLATVSIEVLVLAPILILLLWRVKKYRV